MKYTEQQIWHQLMKQLPEQLHFTKDYQPTEEVWNWKGNKIHLDTFRNADAKAKLLLFHGVGTNGRQLSMIVGGPLAKLGYEVIALDMPLYGVSEITQHKAITYEDWVQAGSEYVNVESERDDRPIFLYGLSAGGMETYHIACCNQKVKGIIGMTFLDQRNQLVRRETASNAFWGHLGTALAGMAVKLGFGRLKMKMSICSKMSALCNQENCLDTMLKDRTSAGNRVPMTFIYSYMTYAPKIAPEKFITCPILLTQPDQDRWTPLHLSTPFLNRIKAVPVTIKLLSHGGHYPVEMTALEQLHSAIEVFIEDRMKDILLN